MMIRAYNHIYLNKASRAAGNMLHDAVLEYGIDGTDFLNRFIQSGIAEQFEEGNPKYIAGKSGLELFYEVMERTSGNHCPTKLIVTYERSDVYWVGWLLAHYQWHSGRSFRHILEVVTFDELLGLYGTLHEADIHKSYEILDARIESGESRLKRARRYSSLTQEELAERSGVSANSIKAYERKSKDLNKAQISTVRKLAKALNCNITDLVD